MTAPRRGARRKINVKDLYSEGSGTPPGCDPINSRIPGGLRGLRPPATFFATLRVAEASQLENRNRGQACYLRFLKRLGFEPCRIANGRLDPNLVLRESAGSARQHKAWVAASKPHDGIKNPTKPAERATDLECGGNPDLSGATPLWIDPIIQSAVAVPTGRDSDGGLQIVSGQNCRICGA